MFLTKRKRDEDDDEDDIEDFIPRKMKYEKRVEVPELEKPIEPSDIDPSLLNFDLLSLVSDNSKDADALINRAKLKRADFRATSSVYTGLDPEIKFRYLLRTIPSLTDDLKIKLKVYLCIHPKFIIPATIDHTMIVSMTSTIDIVTSETTSLNQEHINVLHPTCKYETIHENIRVDTTELYITPLQAEETLSFQRKMIQPHLWRNGTPNWLKKVVFYSFALEIEDNFCVWRKFLTHVSYKGMTSVIKIGDNWMRSCDNLNDPNFTGLSALTTVGSDWMNNCKSLTTLNFEPLSALISVGKYWLQYCTTLVAPNFHGLKSLTTVGDSWMTSCHALRAPNFNGLSSLTTVGDMWMFGCKDLRSVDFTGLSALKSVGRNWLLNCFSPSDDATKSYIFNFWSRYYGGWRKKTTTT